MCAFCRGQTHGNDHPVSHDKGQQVMENEMRCIDIRHCKRPDVNSVLIGGITHYPCRSLGRNSCHDTNIAATGGNTDFSYYNLQYCQLRQSWHRDKVKVKDFFYYNKKSSYIEGHRDWNPFGFICLINSCHYLLYNDLILMTTASVRAQAPRRYGHRSYVTAATSCTEIDQQIPVQPATARPPPQWPPRSSEQQWCQTLKCESIIAYT